MIPMGSASAATTVKLLSWNLVDSGRHLDWDETQNIKPNLMQELRHGMADYGFLGRVIQNIDTVYKDL